MKIKMRKPSQRSLYRLYKGGDFQTIRELCARLNGYRGGDTEWQVLERLVKKGLVRKSVCNAEGKTVASDPKCREYYVGYLDRRMWYSLTEEGKKVAEPIVKKVDEIKETFFASRSRRPHKHNQRKAKNKKHVEEMREELRKRLLEDDGFVENPPLEEIPCRFTPIPSTGVVLIDFYTGWCEPCKILEPIIWELEETFKGKVKFIKVDIEKNTEIASKYKVQLVPTLIIEKDGVLFKKYIGVTRLNVLEADLNSALKKGELEKNGVRV